MRHDQEQRREHLLRLMGDHNLTCGDVAALMQRKPQTVRCWRAGIVPINDHTIWLLELILRHGYHRRAAS